MFFKKNKEKLSVELLDMAVDTSEMINIKDSRVIYINGAGKLKTFFSDGYYPAKIRLNGIPLVRINSPYCPTSNSLLATGYGIENANCQELMEIQKEINADFISLENSIKAMEPLLKLFETGFYLIAEAECYPTDGNGNFFWNVPNEFTDSPATGLAYLKDSDTDTYCVFNQPVYLYPTQTTDCYNEERVEYYIDKFNNEPRAIVYNFGGFINFVIDGHHKACAAALLGKPLKCLLIIKGEYSQNYGEDNQIFLNFLSSNIRKEDIPIKYQPFLKEKEKNWGSMIINEGTVNKRQWEDKYINLSKKYPSLIEYATKVDDLIYENIEINDELINYCLINFDIDSQVKARKIFRNLEFLDVEKAKDFAVRYAKASLKQEISNNLKLVIYNFLVNMKNNSEVEQIFIDYIVCNEDRDDPVLELINSYWK
jgi:putative cytoplasmic protein